MLGGTEVVFIFVAFCIVAGLISKHLTMKHEQALKIREARKGQSPNEADGTGTGSGPPWWYVLLTISAVLISGLLILGLQHETVLQGGASEAITTSFVWKNVVFVFVVFCIIAGLISKQIKLEQKLKQPDLGKVPEAKPKRNSGWGAGWIFLAVASSGVLAMLALALIAVKVERPRLENMSAVNIASAGPSAPALLPESMRDWTEELPFDADQYPGVVECAAPLARMIAKEIKADLATVAKAEETEVEAEAALEASVSVSIVHTELNSRVNGSWWYGSNSKNFDDAFRKALKSEMPNVLFNSPIGKKYELRFGFEEILEFPEAYPERPLTLISGRMACRSPELDKTYSVAFHQKPWLTHFKDFTLENRYYYIGATKKFQPLRSKAHEGAVKEIANRLKLNVEQIEPLIVDKFTQAIERPYGTVFREAILVHNPPVNGVATGYVAVASSSPASASRSLLGRLRFDLFRPSFEFLLALIVCLTVVAGFTSNIVTQGYYRTEISNSLMLVAGVFVSVVLLTVVLGVIV